MNRSDIMHDLKKCKTLQKLDSTIRCCGEDNEHDIEVTVLVWIDCMQAAEFSLDIASGEIEAL